MIEDFILEEDYFFSPDECDQYIDAFGKLEEQGLVSRRSDNHKANGKGVERHNIDDVNVNLAQQNPISTKLAPGTDISEYFVNKFFGCAYPVYTQKYSMLNTFSSHGIYHVKIQKTIPGQAYHTWHNETSTPWDGDRILTFICFLNDVEEGGETEFLYYPRRVKPTKGKLILFPGFFTHTHRGNQPLKGEKYIITGWVEFTA